MAFSSGTSSGSLTIPQGSGSEEVIVIYDAGSKHNVLDGRKQRRKLLNRESARRSREKKQRHLDSLMAELCHLRKENKLIVTKCKFTSEQHVAVEVDNSLLRTQMLELHDRLESLNGILDGQKGGVVNEWGFVNYDYVKMLV